MSCYATAKNSHRKNYNCHGLSVFKNRELRRISEPKTDEVTGGQRKLHNLYSSPNSIRMIKPRKAYGEDENCI